MKTFHPIDVKIKIFDHKILKILWEINVSNGYPLGYQCGQKSFSKNFPPFMYGENLNNKAMYKI